MRTSVPPKAALAAAATIILAASAPAESLRDRLVVHRMKNGMTVLVYPRGDAPVFAATMSMEVAGSDELSGEGGVAHMFEHMAFKGSHILGTTNYEAEVPLMAAMDEAAEEARLELTKADPDEAKVAELRERIRQLQEEQSKYIVKDELDLILERNGATGVNASTSTDFTNYYTELPSNRLELYFWLEAQRMRYPVMREFYSERDVVVEERRQRTDDSPFGALYEAFLTTAFAAHPYGRPVIGWASEITAVTRPMAEAFRVRHYGPKAAVLAIVGKVDPGEVIALSEKYFGDWDAPGEPSRVVTKEPPQRGERRVAVKFDAEPQLMIGWQKPAGPSKDDLALQVFSMLATDTSTSPFYKELVVEKQVATSIGSNTGPGEKYEGLFILTATPRAPHTVAELEAAIDECLARVLENGFTEAELERARRSIEMHYLRTRRSNAAFATALAESANLRDNPFAIEDEMKQALALGTDEIIAAARRYLVRDARTVAWLEK